VLLPRPTTANWANTATCNLCHELLRHVRTCQDWLQTSHPVNNHYNSNLDTFWTNLVSYSAITKGEDIGNVNNTTFKLNITSGYKTFNKTQTHWSQFKRNKSWTEEDLFQYLLLAKEMYWPYLSNSLLSPWHSLQNESKQKKIIHLPSRQESISSCSYPCTDVTILHKNLIH
jgi:hypothetical protein